MKQAKWFDRIFDFTSSKDIFPSIIARLAATPARLEEKFALMPAAITTIRIGDTWTIKENAGHLTDLETLWQGRLQDILSGKTDLRPTDLQNRKTTEANHNAVPVPVLLKNFSTVRMQTINMLQALDEEQMVMYALHPRLKTPMRTIDLFLFVAEHDDHHLSKISELVAVIAENT